MSVCSSGGNKTLYMSELARASMESVLLKFGLYLVVVVDDVSTFKGVSFRWVNCLTYEFTNKFFAEAAMTLAYTWNLIHVDGTGIVCGILTISRLQWLQSMYHLFFCPNLLMMLPKQQ